MDHVFFCGPCSRCLTPLQFCISCFSGATASENCTTMRWQLYLFQDKNSNFILEKLESLLRSNMKIGGLFEREVKTDAVATAIVPLTEYLL